MDEYVEDNFFLIRYILLFSGYWIPETNNRIAKLFYKFYAAFVFIYVDLYFTATEVVCLTYTYKNEDDLIKNLSFTLTHAMGVAKAVYYYTRGDKLKEMMKTLESTELRYESHTELNFFPGMISRKIKRGVTKFTVICFMMPYLTLFAAYGPPTMAAVSVLINGKDRKKLPNKMPYISWMPFSYDTAGSYLLALAYQAGPMFSLGHIISAMDAMCYGMMVCLAGNLSIIQGAFLTIRERCLKRIKGPEWDSDSMNNSAELNAAMNSEMTRICRNLQTVLKACQDLDGLQKYIVLGQVSSIQMIICSCLYLVSSVPVSSKEFYSEIVYLVAMSIQPFMLCLIGNDVTVQAENIIESLWKCDWISGDRKFKGNMLITMARLTKPVYLTAGNFAPLILPTFVAIMKASYSFFTFIKNTTDE